MNLVRAYKLQKLGIEMKPSYQSIFNYLDFRFKDLKIFELKKYPESIFYMNSDGECIFEKYKNYSDAFVKYTNLWELLDDVYLLDYHSIEKLLKFWIKKEYGLEIGDIYPKSALLTIEKEYTHYLYKR